MKTPKEVATLMLNNLTLSELAKAGVDCFFKEDKKYQQGLRKILYSKIPKSEFNYDVNPKDFATLVIEEIAISFRPQTSPENVRKSLRETYEPYFLKTLEETEKKFKPAHFIEITQYIIGEDIMAFNSTHMASESPAKSAPAIERKTFIFGELAENMTDEDIFNKIRSLEDQIESWKQIKNKPQALKAKIKSLKEDIKQLVDFLDQGRPFN